MASRSKTKAADVPVPQTREDCVAMIRELGERQRERTRIEADMNDQMAKIKERYEEQARPHNERITALTQGISIWCAANRSILTQDGKVKTANLGSGEVRWRVTPPKVKLTGVDAVIAALKSFGLDRFLRVKEEVSKDAILADPEAVAAVPGIAITQTEEFVVVPFETELEQVAA